MYYYKIVYEGLDFKWRIIETATTHTIEDYTFEEDAQEHMKFLMAGGAFNGFTPAYVLRKHNYKYTED